MDETQTSTYAHQTATYPEQKIVVRRHRRYQLENDPEQVLASMINDLHADCLRMAEEARRTSTAFYVINIVITLVITVIGIVIGILGINGGSAQNYAISVLGFVVAGINQLAPQFGLAKRSALLKKISKDLLRQARKLKYLVTLDAQTSLQEKRMQYDKICDEVDTLDMAMYKNDIGSSKENPVTASAGTTPTTASDGSSGGNATSSSGAAPPPDGSGGDGANPHASSSNMAPPPDGTSSSSAPNPLTTPSTVPAVRSSANPLTTPSSSLPASPVAHPDHTILLIDSNDL